MKRVGYCPFSSSCHNRESSVVTEILGSMSRHGPLCHDRAGRDVSRQNTLPRSTRGSWARTRPRARDRDFSVATGDSVLGVRDTALCAGDMGTWVHTRRAPCAQ